MGTRESQLLREVSRVTGQDIEIPSEEELLKTINKPVEQMKVEMPEVNKEDTEDFFEKLAIKDEKEEAMNPRKGSMEK
jgi:hypothetical protein